MNTKERTADLIESGMFPHLSVSSAGKRITLPRLPGKSMLLCGTLMRKNCVCARFLPVKFH